MPIRYPDEAGVVIIHDEVMRRMGQSGSGFVYPGGLPYCVDSARDTPERVSLHETLATVAAFYVWCLITNHPFVDGNKRTALQTAVVFIRANGFILSDFQPEEVVSVLNGVATGQIILSELTDWVGKHLRQELGPLS